MAKKTTVTLRRKSLKGNREALFLDFGKKVDLPGKDKPTRNLYLKLHIPGKNKSETRNTIRLAEALRDKYQEHMDQLNYEALLKAAE